MSNLANINYKLLNKAEIARKAGFSREYVRKLLNGQRKNREALALIHLIIKEQLRSA